MAPTFTDKKHQWSYQGMEASTSQTVKGKVRAFTEAEAIEIASKKGSVIVLNLKRISAIATWLTTESKNTAKKRDVNTFLRGYATAASSNMRTEDAIRLATTGIRSKGIQTAASDISSMYTDGMPLYQAFGKYSKMFGDEVSSVMEAGESSGQIYRTLSALADSKERSNRTRGKIISALVYPIMLLLAAGGALVVIITAVIPKIESALEELDAELPFLTRILVGVSDVLKTQFLLLLVVLGATIAVIFTMLNTDTGKMFKSRLALKVPIVGPVTQRLNTSVLCELCGVMLTAGVTQTRTMELLSNAISNRVIAKELGKIPQRLLNGMEFDTALKLSVPKIDPVIPALAQQSAAGLNDPGEPWRRYGQSMAEEADRRADLLKSVMEPLMIAMMGVLIGILAAAVYLPLLKSYTQLETL